MTPPPEQPRERAPKRMSGNVSVSPREPAAKRPTHESTAKRLSRAARRPVKQRRKPGPEQAARAWARKLARQRPGLVDFVLDTLAEANGRPIWRPRLDPTGELILTILSANSADVNAEVAFELLRTAFPSAPTPLGASSDPRPFAGWGGRGLPDLPPPDWSAVEMAPLARLTDVIRPGGLANQKAPGSRPRSRLCAPMAAATPWSSWPRSRHWRLATGSRRSQASARRPRRWSCCSALGCR